ncbi:hypothetical protein Pst134EB_010516 [Puccinia striiformis f. sp. tritici]|nr:hypothetical protein Pst134EB_010516 [Puccinia striiformis f. sp. tritici]
MAAALHSNLNFYISEHSYTLAPGNNNQSQSITINRSDSQISLSAPGPPEKFEKSVTNVAGILGIISLLKTDYLILIHSVKKVTTVFKTAIYTPTKFGVYPISIEPNISLIENNEERYLLSVLKLHLDHLIGKSFLSYYNKLNPNDPEPWDLTNSLQRQPVLTGAEDHAWKVADDRFFWNKFIHSKFIEVASQPNNQEVSKYILPVVFGFLEFKTGSIKGKRFTYGIISRRSRYRAGTRYYSRGINPEGQVSNFNETEMIFTTFPSNFNSDSPANNGKSFVKASFVQTRGSVPIFWSEINNLRYRPDLKIVDFPGSIEATKTHFDDQIQIYGDQWLFNLVNSKGYEKAIKEGYEKAVKNLNNPRVHYTYFDFHQECKGLRFDKVQLLIDILEEELKDQAYFYQDFSVGGTATTPTKVQKSVVRTNCMDCLDRTNVLQSALAKWVLTTQLKQAGILEENDKLDSYNDFMNLFRNIWADNADGVSKSYSGTPALKTDFTRLGIRTKRGAFDDGVNSVMRYVKNNFMDGPRQDSYDLFTGAWVPPTRDSDESQSLLLAGPYDHHLIQAIMLGFVIFLLIFISATFTKKRSLKLSIISLIILSLITVYMLTHGMEFVNQPRLTSSKSNEIRLRILNYNGPKSRCFESSQHGRIKINFKLFDHLVSILFSPKNNNQPVRKKNLASSSNSPLHLKNLANGNLNSSLGTASGTPHLVIDDDKKKRLD